MVILGLGDRTALNQINVHVQVSDQEIMLADLIEKNGKHDLALLVKSTNDGNVSISLYNRNKCICTLLMT